MAVALKSNDVYPEGHVNVYERPLTVGGGQTLPTLETVAARLALTMTVTLVAPQGIVTDDAVSVRESVLTTPVPSPLPLQPLSDDSAVAVSL